MSKESKIVQYTMELLAKNPELNADYLRENLIKNKDYKNLKNYKKMDNKSLEHYIYMGRIFNRLKNLLLIKATGTEEWLDTDYHALVSTGIKLCDKQKALRLLPDTQFLDILKKIAFLLPEDKPTLNSFIDSEINTGEHKSYHDYLRDTAALKYLQENNCSFFSTEVTLEKTHPTSRGLKIDALGWKTDGKICGIEVKTQPSDDKGTKKAIRYDRYIRYCNEFYILTTDNHIYDDSIEWLNSKKYDEMGVILWNKNTMSVEQIKHPTKIKQEVTPAMQRMVQKAFLTKLKKNINNIYLNTSNSTPDLAIKKIKTAISKEFIGF